MMSKNEGTVSREAWPYGITYKERTNGAKEKTTKGQEADMGGNEKRGKMDRKRCYRSRTNRA
jgi:hypothetical protein